MATVSERNLTITIYLHNGDTYEVADERGKKIATSALGDFNARNIVKVIEDDQYVLIPFHSILKVEVTQSTQETEIEDTFCTTRVPEDSNDVNP